MFSQILRLYALFHSHLPTPIEKGIWVLLFFILWDTVTGLWVAMACRKVQSRKYIEGLTSKAAQFSGVLAVSGGAGVMLDSWAPFAGGVILLISNEGLSIIENVRRLQDCGGITLPKPLNDFLDKLAGYLAATPDAPDAPGKELEK